MKNSTTTPGVLGKTIKQNARVAAGTKCTSGPYEPEAVGAPEEPEEPEATLSQRKTRAGIAANRPVAIARTGTAVKKGTGVDAAKAKRKTISAFARRIAARYLFDASERLPLPSKAIAKTIRSAKVL